MMTENESKALQLAKKVFEHFTHDALPIAREIIAMERDLGQPPLNGKPVNGVVKPILEIKKTDGQSINGSMNDFPVSDVSAIGLVANDDSAQTVHSPNEELVHNPEDDLPF